MNNIKVIKPLPKKHRPKSVSSPKKPTKTTKPKPKLVDDSIPEYDPVNHPFSPDETFRATHGTVTPKSNKNNPLVQGLIIIALLLPFIILVTVVIPSLGQFFQDFTTLNDSLKARPGLTEQELVDLFHEFYQNRLNQN